MKTSIICAVFLRKKERKHISVPLRIAFFPPGSSADKESSCNSGDLGLEDSLEKGKATHSCILSWRIPWTV